jgi:hypothetical protein
VTRGLYRARSLLSKPYDAEFYDSYILKIGRNPHLLDDSTMSQFKRRLDRLDSLCGCSNKPEWWNNLLSLWRPSGVPAGEYGLRLAIRDNYLNFYRRGQSIARVEIGIGGTPTATTHIKYVGDSKDESFGQEHVKLGGEWLLRNGEPWKRYECIETLKKWIETVDGSPDAGGEKGYAGIEKDFVDKVVAENPNIIDLEMGLPAWGEQKTAPRMDIVEIEASAEGRSVVFWEAKRNSDSRLRCSVDIVRDEKPEVLKQLAAYRRFLTEEEAHLGLVADAYKNTAKLLKKLREIADGLGEKYPLGSEILAAASESELSVDHNPRLVVLNEKGVNPKAWGEHADKLRKSGVFMSIIEEDGPFLLRRPA